MKHNKDVSRQRAWQLKKLDAYLCTICGKRPLWQAHESCRECTFKRAEKAKARYHERKEGVKCGADATATRAERVNTVKVSTVEENGDAHSSA